MNQPESKQASTEAETPALTEIPLPCRYLRCKEMYYGASEDDEFAGGAFWCERTHEPFGPDGETCSKKHCCANRTCFVT